MPQPSEEIIWQSLAGDRRALDDWLVRNLGDLRAFVRMRMPPELRTRESSLDLVQSTCRKILEHPDKVELRSESSFRSWLFGAVEFEVLNRLRRLRAKRRDPAREVSMDQEEALALLGSYSGDTPSRHAAAHEALARIERAIDELTDDQREVLRLSRFLGLTAAEIGTRIGKRPDAVRSLLHRALSRLSVALERGS